MESLNDSVLIYVPVWLVWLFVILMVLDIANNGLGLLIKMIGWLGFWLERQRMKRFWRKQ